MKCLFSIIVLLSSVSNFAQTNQSAKDGNAKTIESFIPKGWKQIATAKGDLNNDGAEDGAIVIENTDKKNFLINNEGFGHDTLNVNPRRIIILFKESGGYAIKAVNDKFIPTENDSTDYCLNDPFVKSADGFYIKKGILTVSFTQEAICGRYHARDKQYKFRMQQNDFALIGYDVSSSDRETGDIEEVSINFLSRKKTLTTGGNDFQQELNHPKVISKVFKLPKLISLSALKKEWDNGFDF